MRKLRIFVRIKLTEEWFTVWHRHQITELSVLAGERGVNQNEDNQQQMLLIPGLGLMIKASEKIYIFWRSFGVTHKKKYS